MSVLLRQPHGFEGLGTVEILLSSHDLAAFECPDLSDAACRLGTPLPAPRPEDRADDDPVAVIESSSSGCTSKSSRTQASTQLSDHRSDAVVADDRSLASGESATSESTRTSGAIASRTARSVAPVQRARSTRRTSSTFSCDIAYSDSPTASRASAWSLKNSTRTSCPCAPCRRTCTSMFELRPLPSPRQIERSATTRSPSVDESRSVSTASASKASRMLLPLAHDRLSAHDRLRSSGQRPHTARSTSGRTTHRSASMSPAFQASMLGSHDLHVLLRHRPRSIPQAQESA